LLQADARLKASATEPRRRIAIVTTLRVPKTGGIPTTKVIVVKWLKRKGQKVRAGEPLVELQTDKVNYELDSPVEGVLLEIVAKEDSEVPVGDMLCHIGQPGEAVPTS
jgi:pyruvate/2-oxoglutarate dehydrogenase complex dihydrolipoamide acyltransferase (E2) component